MKRVICLFIFIAIMFLIVSCTKNYAHVSLTQLPAPISQGERVTFRNEFSIELPEGWTYICRTDSISICSNDKTNIDIGLLKNNSLKAEEQAAEDSIIVEKYNSRIIEKDEQRIGENNIYYIKYYKDQYKANYYMDFDNAIILIKYTSASDFTSSDEVLFMDMLGSMKAIK